jgi:hypothetical protein
MGETEPVEMCGNPLSMPRNSKRFFLQSGLIQRWQIHLSTTVVMMVVAAVSMRFMIPKFRDYCSFLDDDGPIKGYISTWPMHLEFFAVCVGWLFWMFTVSILCEYLIRRRAEL